MGHSSLIEGSGAKPRSVRLQPTRQCGTRLSCLRRLESLSDSNSHCSCCFPCSLEVYVRGSGINVMGSPPPEAQRVLEPGRQLHRIRAVTTWKRCLTWKFATFRVERPRFLTGSAPETSKAQCRLSGNLDIPWEGAEMMRDYYR